MGDVNVHIGQVKIAKNGETLKALLGSCVGIGVLWRRRNLYGLAHCLLPRAPAPTFEMGGRFVDQAVASLLALMKIRSEDLPEVEIVLAGGGNMTGSEPAGSARTVGEANFLAAEEEILKKGLRLVCKDVGGLEARKIIIEAASGVFRIDRIPSNWRRE